eukprot:2699510-Lingulodinium_polyedra.AAC.1
MQLYPSTDPVAAWTTAGESRSVDAHIPPIGVNTLAYLADDCDDATSSATSSDSGREAIDVLPDLANMAEAEAAE